MNKLIAIGFMGDYSVYLNVSLDEAKRRYSEANDGVDANDYDIIELEVKDEFNAYHIW